MIPFNGLVGQLSFLQLQIDADLEPEAHDKHVKATPKIGID